MATMTISYDGRSSVMKHLIEAMLAAGAKVLQPETKGSYQLSQEDIRAGRVETFASSSDMFQSLGI